MKDYGTLGLIFEFTLTDKVTNGLIHTFLLFIDRLVGRHTPTDDYASFIKRGGFHSLVD